MKEVSILGHKDITLNIWGKSTLLISVLSREGLLPNCAIYWHDECDGTGHYCINGIPVGVSEEEVTTAIWRMVACFTSEGHISIDDMEHA